MENFTNVYEIIWSTLAIYVGIVGVSFNKWGTRINARGFEWMYKKTKLPIFKLQSEETRRSAMRIFMFLLGLVALVLGISSLINIFV